MSTHETITQTTPLGQVRVTVIRHVIDVPAPFNVPYEGADPLVQQAFPDGFSPSYGSGLAFKGIHAGGDLEFYCLTDRGPNGDGPRVPAPDGAGMMDSKIFPAPSFTPAIGIFRVGVQGAALASSVPIRLGAGLIASGLPLPHGTPGNSAEIPLHDALRFDPSGKAIFHA
ncbi:MAG: esterase-like activity of phytase family protein, partial [Telluria sp.]